LIGGAGLIALTAIAYAAVPSASGVITGCYNTTSGALRVIDAEAGAGCKATETLISWNQKGPAAPQVPSGPPGPRGLTGPQGVMGPAGASAAPS
jgi:hypothetical protein